MSAREVVRSHPDGSLITIWVVPGARRNEIVGYYAGALRVRITAVAEKGRANKALLAFLEKTLGCRLRLIGGAGSRRKRVVAIDLPAEDLISRLDKAWN
jgi:uncharacterized protein